MGSSRMEKEQGSPGKGPIPQWRAWSWIALVFGVQLLCSIAFSGLVNLSPADILLPLLVLLAGCSWALWMRRRHPDPIPPRQRWVPVGLYVLFIFFMSNRTFPGVDVSFDVSFFHPLEYATLGFFLGWALDGPSGRKVPTMLKLLFGGLVLGLFDEIHQSFVPGRHPSVLDLALDVAGTCAGGSIYRWVSAYQTDFRRAWPPPSRTGPAETAS